MTHSAPHYMLRLRTEGPCGRGAWQFRLDRVDAHDRLEVADAEPRERGERLELLTLVRALESLDQPSHISLVGGSDSLRRGINYGLSEWRENGWRWEYFGQMVPVKNLDLWQRLDHALRFHRVECRYWRIDPRHAPAEVCGGYSAQTESDNLEILEDSGIRADWGRERLLAPLCSLRECARAALLAVRKYLGGRSPEVGRGCPAHHHAQTLA